MGGTFDPPHIGHLWLAETAWSQLGLERVLFLPVGEPPHKQTGTAVSHRLQMLTLAIHGNAHFFIDETDIHRPPPHTTITLLPLLQAKYPEAELWLILGSDSLRDLTSWVQPQKLIDQCQLAVLPRPNVVIDWHVLETAVPNIRQRTHMLKGPTVDISSTDIRQWTETKQSLRYVLPTAVQEYLEHEQLYT